MIISEFGKPVTAKSLNESLAKRFGSRIKLENFTLEQLQDARNKIRTKLSQIEMSESFNAVVEGDDYQKSKLFLDVLNAEISERGDIEDDMLEAAKPDADGDGVPDWADKKDGPDPKPKKKGTKNMPPQLKKHAEKKMKGESVVREGAEDNAEIIMAAKDMVDRVTNWMEDTAEMQTESMLELADAIRDEMGVDQSTQFVQGVKPALEGLYTAMEQARESLSNGVGLLTGEGGAAPAMGAEEMPADDMGMEPTVDMDAAEPMPAEGDVDLAAAGGEEPAGRETRESVDPRKLAQKLSKKK